MPRILLVEDQPAVATALPVLFEIRGVACTVERRLKEMK
jgi:DNA-binding response OmpR family regulator